MTAVYDCFLNVLAKGVVSEKYMSHPFSEEEWRGVLRLARVHHVLPIIVEALWNTEMLPDTASTEYLKRLAVNKTAAQAHRTAEVLSVYELLSLNDLKPVIMKGLPVRSLYPFPEQRESIDEDLLINPSEWKAYHLALLDLGFTVINDENIENAGEVTYLSKERSLEIEVHKYPFPPESVAYGECNRCFKSALKRTVEVECYGYSVRTLHPTDHILYMICHAYKHFLHGGVGIRQVCDIGIFSKAYGNQIDWNYVFASCRGLHIEVFAAGLFKVSEHLGFLSPTVFQAIEIDETDLLNDILSGGLYGTEDVDRLHSSMITLNTAAAYNKGKKKSSLIRSVFPPMDSMSGRYTYLRSHPWLLPAAWTQRIIAYVKNRKRVDPKRSVQIGKERVQLLKEYGVID